MSRNISLAQAGEARQRRYAFVVPRFGEDIVGGAETLVGNLARRVAARGDYVEILTTCAKDNRTWENFFEPGEASAFDLPVKRFLVDQRDLESWIPKQIALHEGMRLSVDDQLEWMAESVNSKALYEHIASTASKFDALFFAPYLFGTTFWGSLIAPERSYLIPCLHDEHYAYTEVIQSMFSKVAGALFNAPPEQELAERLCGAIPGGEVGMGFEPVPDETKRALTPYFEDDFPYLIYVGRKETGKNVQLLVDCFISAKDRKLIDSELNLVILGGGDFSDVQRPDALQRGDILDVGHVSERDKQRLIRHATLLVQPSVNESFSIVLMEAWLLGTPVLVHAKCPVTRHHVVQSGGGLYFSDEDDFSGVVQAVMEDSTLLQQMALAGERYVHSYYNWDAVLDRFDSVMDKFLE